MTEHTAWCNFLQIYAIILRAAQFIHTIVKEATTNFSE